MTVARGEVWWADLPHLGRRPALVVSAQTLNRVLTHVTAARITGADRERSLPSYVPLEPPEGELPERSFVLCHELHPIPKAALRERVGQLGPTRMSEVETALRMALDLDG
jgi:mRNA-degrading endonuclease toxin of MazEF toxin-antitoxin module